MQRKEGRKISNVAVDDGTCCGQSIVRQCPRTNDAFAFDELASPGVSQVDADILVGETGSKVE